MKNYTYLKVICVFWLAIFATNLVAQNCVLESENWTTLFQSKLKEAEKTKVKDALNRFIVNYNKYADIYDEEYDLWSERDFLKLIDGGNSSTQYLNDMILSPTNMQAYDYITLLSEHFPTGYNFCLKSIRITEARQLQDNLYSVSFEGIKAVNNYIDVNKVVELQRDIVINFDMVIFGNENKEELTAAISTANLVKINAINDIAIVDVPANKKSKPERPTKTKIKEENKDVVITEKPQKKVKTKPEPYKRPELNEVNVKTRDFKIIYAEGGYGFTQNELINGLTKSDLKSSSNHFGLGVDYWKSLNPSNKFFFSAGLLLRYHSIKDEINKDITSDTYVTTISDRAPKNSIFKMEKNGKIDQTAIAVYAPIGIVYNFGRGNDPRVFTLQATVMPGYVVSASRNIAGASTFTSYYGDSININNCLITEKELNSSLDIKKGFTLAAKLSPTFVYESRSWQGKRGFGYIFGLDFTFGLTPLLSSESINPVSATDLVKQKLTVNKSAAFFNKTSTYSALGARIGIYYVLN